MGEDGATRREPLFHRGETSCIACGACARRCPARAIRLTESGPVIDTARCIACGDCVTGGRPGCWEARSDVADVLALLRGGRPVVALLAAEARAALYPLSLQQAEGSLRMLGFTAVEDTLLGEELVAREYERLAARGDALLLLRSTCPVATALVRTRFPALVPALACVVPPYVAQARLIKALYPAGTAVVYAGPCYARKDEALDPAFDGAVDAAIDLGELKRLLARLDELPTRIVPPVTPPRPAVLRERSLTDGFPRRALLGGAGVRTRLRVVRGIPAIEELFEAMTRGETAPAFVDMLACDGCVGGPAVAPGRPASAKRGAQAAADRAERAGAPDAPGAQELLAVLPAVALRRSFDAASAPAPHASDVEAREELAASGLAAAAGPAPDCGACGYPTCLEHARAVREGLSAWTLCPMLLRRRLATAESGLAAATRVDARTGLPDRRAAEERLSLELARHARYGAPLALLLLAVDASVTALPALGEQLAGRLRATDLLAHLGEGRFLALLPDTAKTQAFAVAEKLRAVTVVPASRPAASAPASPVPSSAAPPARGYRDDMPVRVRIGVAMANGERTRPAQLLGAAEEALREALADGGDVRLAPG